MKKEHIGDKIKWLRTQRGLTLKKLGEEVQFNYSNLSKIERGLRKPTVDFLERLTNYYKVDISYFFDLKKNDEISQQNEQDQYVLTTERKK
ncbi:helix-turn-helix domain-containing protein [Fredinandcohnia quinoae]|uniref:Helix-turn-helix domain-containing protein n=1 Tax=Fredinandcohnia quinoae TaxID=2918902 RepID=A0AAW5DW93_9BACI|nr:helix-turn-helix transcriptional regulator [Fredinandcohnia sp. SECRCQ15]MCH1624901.1 helix-turn-helix domain-containing protein [Fredinandcohnia sp. SECRCQ15]